jgi:hypothetical protein
MFSLSKLSDATKRAVKGAAKRIKDAVTPPPTQATRAELFLGQHTNARKNAWRALKRKIGARRARIELKAFRRAQRETLAS